MFIVNLNYENRKQPAAIFIKIEGCPTLIARTSYRVVGGDDGYSVQKRAGADWRNDNTVAGETIEELVEIITKKT